MKLDVTISILHLSSIPSFSILQLINRDRFSILNAYLPSEATRLKTSITFVVRTMETLVPSVVFKMRTCPWTHETIIIYTVKCISWLTILSTSRLWEENTSPSRSSKLPASAIDFNSFIYGSLVGHLWI